MSGIVLTAYPGAFLGPIAKFLGWIMNGIYMLMYNLFGIENVGLSIILFTIVIYLCMLPLTIKQQKFSKLSQQMQPEIQAVQNKYKNRKDQESMSAMNQELSLVYQKYGVSPMGTCLPTLIQMPILLALYRVFANVPAYIGNIKEHFSALTEGIINTDGFVEKLTSLTGELKVNMVGIDLTAEGEKLSNYVVDVLYKLPSAGWDNLMELFPLLGKEISETVEHINHFNYFCMLNISENPFFIIKNNFSENLLIAFLALMVPVLSYLTQILNIKMMPQSNTNDQMAQQMKTMNTFMPLVSLFMCFTVPVGLGIYWIMGAVCRAVQQFFINRYFRNLDLDDVIRKNQEKAEKKREKMGIYQDQIRNNAQMKTRSIESKAKMNTSAETELQLEKVTQQKVNVKPGSMTAKANMVREYNERNSRK